MTLKEVVLQSLAEIKSLTNYMEVYNHIVNNKYYDFGESKTPASTVSSMLGHFIRHGDSRVKRISGKGGTYFYYLAKYEHEIGLDTFTKMQPEEKSLSAYKTFHERDLHILLSSYLKSNETFSKTIFHEQSKTSKDNHQKWIHPDMIGIKFLNLKTIPSNLFLKAVNRSDTFKLTSYEIKKEITNDYDLKKYFFQAVSNSSWANYGYLVAFEISDSLEEEMERLNQSFGIGIINLKANPFETKVLFPSKYRDLDFKTIDKLCHINVDFRRFIEQVEKLLSAEEKYAHLTRRELEELCDKYFGSDSDSQIERYCQEKNIPIEKLDDL